MKKEKKVTKAKLKLLERKERTRKDNEWAEAVKKRDGYKCAYSGSTDFLNSAHIIPREIEAFRWDIDNGLTLRAKFHKMHPKESEDKSMFSAHFNPFAMLVWFSNTRPDQFGRLLDKWLRYLNEGRQEETNSS